MIFETPVWLIFRKQTNKKKAIGKWIWEALVKTFLNEEFAIKLNSLVEDGKILSAKFALKNPWNDPFPYKKESVLCVYTLRVIDPEAKKAISDILGFKPVQYKLEVQTKMDWADGGKLKKEYEEFWKC